MLRMALSFYGLRRLESRWLMNYGRLPPFQQGFKGSRLLLGRCPRVREGHPMPETIACQQKVCTSHVKFKLIECKERASMTNFLET
jgi:hypothetical protein